MADPKELTYTQLRKQLCEVYSEEEMQSIDKAYEIAAKAHEGQKRYSGQPYISHPVAVAKILLDFGMDY
ncbi:MAG: HD domain-containing protein, partial [Clostridiales bacterium]|nr:HD domain-containing protein [Clostridiales bacterium]